MQVAPFAGDAREWDEFVRRAPGWTHFHLHGWRAVIERVFGHECIYLAARDADGALAGVLPLVRVRSIVFGHYLVSMPFVNYGGALGNAAAVCALVDAAAAIARDSGVRLLELRSRVPLDVPLPVSHRKVASLLDLPASGAALFQSLPSKLRSQIRRPMKEGVEVRFGADQVEPFFRVFARHMRDLGTPTQPLSLFATIADCFPGDAWFACAYWRGRPVAAGAGFAWDREVEITWASALPEYKTFAPNMLLYWRILEWAADTGMATFNFGRSSPGSGPHRFKQQWGARDEPLWWYALARSARAATPSPTDGGYAWGPRLWRRLPAWVATALGPRIVRYIP